MEEQVDGLTFNIMNYNSQVGFNTDLAIFF